jgi:hypothetical protein
MSEDLALESLKDKLKDFKKVAALPIIQAGDGDLLASKLSGKPWLSPSEDYPICPNCGNPMQPIVQINLDRIPASFGGKFGGGLLQFFYCGNTVVANHDSGLRVTKSDPEDILSELHEEAIENVKNLLIEGANWVTVEWDREEIVGRVIVSEVTQNCAIECNGWEPFSLCQLVRIVQPTSPSKDFDLPSIDDRLEPQSIVGWEEIEDYPNLMELDEFDNETIADEDERDLYFDGDLNCLGDKLGGWISDDPCYPDCPDCEGPMNQLIFQTSCEYVSIKNDVNIVQCPIHKQRVACFQS